MKNFSNSGTYCNSANNGTQKLEILHLKFQNLSEKFENIKSTYFIS